MMSDSTKHTGRGGYRPGSGRKTRYSLTHQVSLRVSEEAAAWIATKTNKAAYIDSLVITDKNKSIMGLDKNCKDAPYLLGRTVAMIERECDGTPSDFMDLCSPGKNNQSYQYWLSEALRKVADDLVEVAAELGALGISSPAKVLDPRGQYHIGYYHQRKHDGEGKQM